MSICNKHFCFIKITFIFLSIACMFIIFLFSSQNSDESSDTSEKITQIVVKACIPDYNEISTIKKKEIISTIHIFIRKAAHFSIFGLLGFLVSCSFGKRRLISKKTLHSVIICFAYACSDEIHQSFIPGRSCQFTDVLIDLSGSICGIFFSIFCIYLINRIQNKNSL